MTSPESLEPHRCPHCGSAEWPFEPEKRARPKPDAESLVQFLREARAMLELRWREQEPDDFRSRWLADCDAALRPAQEDGKS